MPEPSTGPEHQPVVAAIVTSPLGVLVGRRNDGNPPWTFIGGAIEPGESAAHAAVREVQEEAGLAAAAESTENPVELAEVRSAKQTSCSLGCFNPSASTSPTPSPDRPGRRARRNRTRSSAHLTAAHARGHTSFAAPALNMGISLWSDPSEQHQYVPVRII